MKWRGRLDLALDYEFLKIDKGFRFFYVQQQIMICEIKKRQQQQADLETHAIVMFHVGFFVNSTNEIQFQSPNTSQSINFNCKFNRYWKRKTLEKNINKNNM